jgi:hypothetical protein
MDETMSNEVILEESEIDESGRGSRRRKAAKKAIKIAKRGHSQFWVLSSLLFGYIVWFFSLCIGLHKYTKYSRKEFKQVSFIIVSVLLLLLGWFFAKITSELSLQFLDSGQALITLRTELPRSLGFTLVLRLETVIVSVVALIPFVIVGLIGYSIWSEWRPKTGTVVSRLSKRRDSGSDDLPETAGRHSDQSVHLETGGGHNGQLLERDINYPEDHCLKEVKSGPLVGLPGTDSELTYAEDSDEILMSATIYGKLTGGQWDLSDPESTSSELFSNELIRTMHSHEQVDLGIEHRIAPVEGTLRRRIETDSEKEVVELVPVAVAIGNKDEAENAIKSLINEYEIYLGEKLGDEVSIDAEIARHETIPDKLQSAKVSTPSVARILTPFASRQALVVDADRLAEVMPIVDGDERPEGLATEPRTRSPRSTRPGNLDSYRDPTAGGDEHNGHGR